MHLHSLDEAIAWLNSVWINDRPTPIRLHDIETVNQGELGAPRMTGSFLGYLLARPDDTIDQEVQVDCPQPVHRGDDWMGSSACITCGGLMRYTVIRSRWRYPLWRAIQALERQPAKRPGQPRPIEIVGQLAATWSARMAHRIANVETPLPWDVYEPLALMAIRDLATRYSLGPIEHRRPSESQSIAEAVA
jgi:hypothetical protein